MENQESRRFIMKVVLFDIDGTLLHSGGAGRMAMIQAFQELYGISNGFEGISMAGKTDPAIVKSALEKHHLQVNDQAVQKFKSRYFVLLSEKIVTELPEKRIYPGVQELLEKLHQHSGVRLGLLTGNWIEGAKIKLKHFGFDSYFAFGAYGSDSMDRNELLPVALRRCNECLNHSIAPDDTIVIGDTPNDIRCAKVHQAKALGVATGDFSVTELLRQGADWAVQDFSDPDAIIRWIVR